uniref:Uncharacterized protein n=1 Tax=Trypanosoma congolense (strain IL3000) TaxID=1068625 RepID=G0UTN0_TRYCI|nr:conserved hypothetical protein [Trypanosoma congolense IL3000]
MNDSRKSDVKEEQDNSCKYLFHANFSGKPHASGKALSSDGAKGVTSFTDVEITEKITLVNDIKSAYTSTGYPRCASGDRPNKAIYGALVELRNPSLHSVTLPPDETIITVSLSAASAGESKWGGTTQSANSAAFRTPLLRVVWKRGSHLLNPRVADCCESPLPESPITSQAAAPSVTLPKLPTYGVERHLQHFPDGIHNVETSERLNDLLLGVSPRLGASGADGAHCVSCGCDRSENNNENNERSGTDRSGSTNKGTYVEGERISGCSGAQETQTRQREQPIRGLPIQLTLVTACSFNHLTLYAVQHQGGKISSVTPLQTVIASVATRKITSHCTFLLCVETSTTHVSLGMRKPGNTPVLHGAESKQPKKRNMRNPRSASDALKYESSGWTPREGGTSFTFEQLEHSDEVSDGMRGTSAATVYFAVEPYMLLGNQSGDIILFSVFKGKTVQRLNSSGAPGENSPAKGGVTDPCPKQRVSAAVSCIVEVSCGAEKRLTCLIANARASRERLKKSFTAPSVGAAGMPPSVFAVGFDDGQVLLLHITGEGAYLSRHITIFSGSPVRKISMRTPSVFSKLWRAPQQEEWGNGCREHSSLLNVVVVPAEIVVFNKDGAIAAVSSCGGALCLMKMPGMEEEVCRVTAFESNTAGDFLSLQWVPSHRDAALLPDLLIATNEDDSIGVYRFVKGKRDLTNGAERKLSWSSEGPSLVLGIDRQDSTLSTDTLQSSLMLVSRCSFHHSWVVDLCTLPHQNGNLLIATSYDRRNSFWPIGYSDTPPDTSVDWPPRCGGYETLLQRYSSTGFVRDFGSALRNDGCTFPTEPAAAFVMHKGAVSRCITGGTETSYFIVSLCLQGFVKFWEVKCKA